jgi:hypothetical protein
MMRIGALLFTMGLLTSIYMSKKVQAWKTEPLEKPLLRKAKTQTDSGSGDDDAKNRDGDAEEIVNGSSGRQTFSCWSELRTPERC